MKKTLAILLSIVMACAFFGCSKKEADIVTTEPTTEATTEPTTQAPSTANPLTGASDFNEAALGVRPAAIVVENLSPARPQWGINSPDIIVEGEVEGGISRMLWLYADYTSVPDKVGPLRSARPSYVQFSELFDAVFIHWGGSHSKAGYRGGYTVIKEDKVDHINGMDGGSLFGRDTTRSVSSEHRGILNGTKIAAMIEKKGFRTSINTAHFPNLAFNDSVAPAGATAANKFSVKFSDRTDTRAFAYSTSDGLYHTNDWKTDVSFQNVVILKTDSKYTTTPYKGSTTTYLDYSVLNSSGSGYYASNGTSTEITWSTQSGTLELFDATGAPLSLNVGHSYIGLCSANHNGKVTME